MNKIFDFFQWLWDLLPTVQCVMCFQWFPKKKTDTHPISTGALVPVCNECWDKYTKFTGEK
jgi:NAD-dependent SIR2 family protein deacetylase